MLLYQFIGLKIDNIYIYNMKTIKKYKNLRDSVNRMRPQEKKE